MLVSTSAPRPDSTRVHYMRAVIDALRSNGGSARPSYVYKWLTDQGRRRPQHTPDGMNPERHYEREVRFARQELADGGWIVSKDHIWVLTLQAEGELSSTEARRIVRDNRVRRTRRDSTDNASDAMNAIAINAFESRIEKPTTGPRPSTWQGTIFREDGPASTYVFRFEGSDLWKIGFASDVDERLAAINRHLPIEIVQRRWMRALSVRWDSQTWAYTMEQEVLARLGNNRTMFERVMCSHMQLQAAWSEAQDIVNAMKLNQGL